MPRFFHGHNNFHFGEVSPRFYGRTDLDVYKNAARKLQNFLVMESGGVVKRPGTQIIELLINDVDAIPDPCLIIPKGNNYLVFITTETGSWANGIAVYKISNRQWVTSGTFGKTSGPATYPAFSGYTSAEDLRAVKYAEYGNLMVIVNTNSPHPPIFIRDDEPITDIWNEDFGYFDPKATNPPSSSTTPANLFQKLGGGGSGTTFGAFPVYKKVPYIPSNTSAGTLNPSATTGTITVTPTSFTSDTEWITGFSFVKITHSGTTGTVVTDDAVKPQVGTPFNASVLDTLGGATAVSNFEQSAWGGTSTWPKAVAIFHQRLIYALDNGVYASQAGDLNEFMEIRDHEDSKFALATNDRPFSFFIPNVKDSQWLVGKEDLLFGGDSGEFTIRPGDTTLGIGPGSISVDEQTSVGSDHIQALKTGKTVTFLGRDKITLFELLINGNRYETFNITKYADHITTVGYDRASFSNPTIDRVAYSKAPGAVIWTVDNNGYLWGCTRDLETGVLAWHRHIIGGALSSEDPKVLSVAVQKNPSTSEEDVYLIVKRTINGASKVTLEKIGAKFRGNSLVSSTTTEVGKPIFMDAALLMNNSDYDITFAATYTTDENAIKSEGSAAGTLSSATVSGGALVCTGGTAKHVSYSPTSNIDLSGDWSIRITYEPNYTGTPASDQSLFSIATSDSANTTELTLLHNTSGNLVFSYTGATATRTLSTAFSPTPGNVYDLFITFKSSSTQSRLFIDGVSKDTEPNTPGAFGSVAQFVIGTNYDETDTADFKIHDFTFMTSEFFDTTNYLTTDPKIPLRPMFAAGEAYCLYRWLEGQTVQILEEGGYSGTETVTGGTVSLDNTDNTEVIVGLGYVSDLETLDLNAGSVQGEDALNKMKRVDQATINFDRAISCKIGRSVDTLEEIPFRDADLDLDKVTPLFTGKKVIIFPGDYERASRVYLRSDEPLPCSIVNIISRGVTYD